MKKLFALILALALSLSLFGCGAENGDTKTPDDAANGTEETADNFYKGKTVTVVCPFGAGGDTDYNARLVAQCLSDKLGGNFIVQNVTGNTGSVGAKQVLDADPDGLTMLFSHTALVCNQAAGLVDFGYQDFDMCCIAADKDGGTYYMRTDNPYGITDLASLVAYTKDHPGELTMTANVGGTSHLGALIMKDYGANCALVDFGGASERLAALLGSQVDVATCAYAAAKEYVDSGEFFCLGYLSKEVNPEMDPEQYPCLTELGVPESWSMYYSVAFPKGVDPEIISLVSETIGDMVLNDTDYAANIAETYAQSPCYYDTDDTLKIYGEMYDTAMKYADALKSGNL